MPPHSGALNPVASPPPPLELVVEIDVAARNSFELAVTQLRLAYSEHRLHSIVEMLENVENVLVMNG
jgi:hypothetical protein